MTTTMSDSEQSRVLVIAPTEHAARETLARLLASPAVLLALAAEEIGTFAGVKLVADRRVPPDIIVARAPRFTEHDRHGPYAVIPDAARRRRRGGT